MDRCAASRGNPGAPARARTAGEVDRRPRGRAGFVLRANAGSTFRAVGRGLLLAALALTLGGRPASAAAADAASAPPAVDAPAPTPAPTPASSPPPAANRPSAIAFAAGPAIDAVSVSPSGRRMALLSTGTNGRRRAAVIDLDPIGQPRIVAAFADADVTSVRWVNDNRLVVSAFEDGAVIRDGLGGVFAVNHDGSDWRQLIVWSDRNNDSAASHIRSRVLPYGWRLERTIDDGSDDVLVARDVRDSAGDLSQRVLGRLDTSTGELRTQASGQPPGTRRWLFDAGLEARWIVSEQAGRTRVHWRAPEGDGWQTVADFEPLTEPGMTPWFAEPDGRLLVESRRGGDTIGLYRYDPRSGRYDDEPVLAVKGYDLEPAATQDSRSGRLLGVHFTTTRPMSYWIDPVMASLQKGIDTALPPGRSNRLYCGRCETTRYFVVRSSSDRQPGEYFLFDRQTSSIQELGASRPWIRESAQGTRTAYRVTTRDGASMPVVLTRPAGAPDNQPLPAVVVVHGGPFAPGASLRWDGHAQFLASRGYLVIEPSFRGSTHYGYAWYRAGWQQWGSGMLDDLADAVKWAAAQKWVDPARVCIEGTSYGGYAALMSTIAHPRVYRCAASFAGVTDLPLLFTLLRSDLSDSARRYFLPVLLGDLERDAARLSAESPLKRVAEIKVPVLLAQGREDRRVPMEHAERFASAARSAGVALEKVDYDNEGHGFYRAGNEADYLTRLEKFLDRSLKPAP